MVFLQNYKLIKFMEFNKYFTNDFQINNLLLIKLEK